MNKQKLIKLNYEIIVINDGSTDKTKELLENNKNLFFSKLINNERNSGKGFSVKEGLKVASGDYIISRRRS